MYETSLILSAPSRQVASGVSALLKTAFRLTLVASTHDEQTLLALQHVLGQRLQRLVHAQHLADLLGNVVQTVDDLLSSGSLPDRVVGQLHRHHDESNVLRGVRLGRGNTDLRTGVDVHTAVRLSREGRLW